MSMTTILPSKQENDHRAASLVGRQKRFFLQKRVQRRLETGLPWFALRSLLRIFTETPWTDHHRERQAIFVHIPKNAGNSISNALYGVPFIGHDPLLHFFAFDESTAAASHKFAFVRNPRDRLVSAFHYLKSDKRTGIDRDFATRYLSDFPDFTAFAHALERRADLLAWHHFRPQCEFLEVRGKIAADWIGRVETIDEGCAELSKHLGIAIQPERLNKSDRRDYRQYYDIKAAEIVSRLYARDIQLFDYRFDR